MIGKVNWKVYLSYMKDLGNIISIISFLLYLVGQGLESGSSYWLSFWADSNGADPVHANDNTPFYLGVYSGIGALQIVIMIFREIVLFIACADASNLIHARLLSKVVSSPMSFFDTNPIGRIVNRFSADIGTVDDGIPFQISLLFECFTSIATVLALICYSLPIFMTVILPLALMYYGIQRCYISTTRQLQRIESIVISPIFAHFGDSLNGVQSIRAYRQEERFILESEKRVDKGVQLHYMCVMMNRWLGVRIEFLANLVVFFVALFAVLSRGTISPGLTGLAITFSLNVTGMLNWLIRAVCDMETDAVALERILEYSENPQEADWALPEDDKHSDFPMEGQIEFSKYQTRYREGLDLVLKDVSMRIQPKEKIGICGRTGAGKSSLTLALFRIIEPVSGKILLDGIDVNTLGLHKLRGGLTIIPQDPVLFTGNVRFNLDPTEENTDNQIWQALEHANLKAHITSLTNGLDHEVSEGGDNFSVGQRQLLCLARALLRKTKILILDEATAAVDLETDDLIQATIRKEFADCTVLTIAHRLNTILDSDRVAVFSEGKLVELDSPQSLMDKHDSVFRGLAKNADQFWNSSVSWNTESPRLSLCFQDTFLTVIPCAIVFTLEPFWLWFKKSRRNSHHVFPTPRRFGKVFSTRVLLTLLLTASCITQVILNSNRRGAFGSEVFHYTLLIGTYIGVIAFECLDQWNNTANSPPIFLFWLSMGFCQLPVLQTQVSYLLAHPSNGIYWVVSLAHYPIIILQLLVHSISSNAQVGDWSLEANASFPSLLCFTWMNQFICKGICSPITDHFQIPKAPSMLDPSRLRRKFGPHPQHRDGTLSRQIIRSTWKRLVLTFILGVSAIILSFLPTLFLRLLILHCQNPEQSWKGFFFAIALFLGVTVESVVLNQFFKQTTVLAQQVSSGLAALIFQKTLKIPARVRNNLEIGQIANLISNDLIAVGNNAIIKRSAEQFPIGLGCLVKALVSFERISNFLEMPESPEDAIQIHPARDNSDDELALTIVGQDFCTNLRQGESIGIYPQPNATISFPQAACDNEEQLGIQVKVHKPMSFVPNQPWIQNDSLKSNILFGRPFKEDQYHAVLEVCHLKQDLELLPQGDETDLGPLGINLNEDQKQKVSLARALYSHQDVCILGMMPPNVNADEIFKFLRNTTVVLFSHDIRLMSLVDRVISLDEGHSPRLEVSSEFRQNQSGFERDSCITRPNTAKVKLVAVDNEPCTQGSVSFRVYLYYIKAYGPCLVPLVLGMFLVAHGLDLACKYWLSLWAKANEGDVSSNVTPLYYLCIYGAIGGIQGIFIVAKDICLFLGCTRASRTIHKDLISTTMAFPMSFFKSTLFGNILNRFSIDIGGVDDVIPTQLAVFLNCVSALIMIFIVIGSTLPIFMVLILPLAMFYYSIHIIYLTSYRQLQRLNVLTRSELLNFISEITAGAETIRMFEQEHRIQSVSEFKINKAIQSSYTMEMMRRWLALRMEFLGNMILFGTAILSVWYTDSITPSLVGLILSFSLEVTHILNWLMRAISDLDSQFVALERIRGYQNVPKETVWTNEDDGNGLIPKFQELTVDIAPSMKFAIKAGEKIVVVDPSGGAARDLVDQMFHLSDSTNGTILLNGEDIRTHEKGYLRLWVRFVSSEPIIFPGTVKSIMDPNNIHVEHEMRNVLSRFGISDLKLDEIIHSYDNPIPIQKIWLLFVARFVLEPPPVLLLEFPLLKDHESEIMAILNPILEEELREVCVILFTRKTFFCQTAPQ
ncbi:hypothetical protein TCAL_11607 [Tigriopus californicus]|uniref:ABC-type glutathione-S-conjugate transporter n=1 Tax=Tigriopus californicus TaxID=6832 RepID=A0A553PDC0_TIGCA|nr:hypothetical protein TCAL_11607 [Tigriopus californicus]